MDDERQSPMMVDAGAVPRHLAVIDPTTDPRWEVFVQSRADSDVFHTTAWARVLMETYGYLPRYHIMEDAQHRIIAGWPAMLVDSRLTGKRLVSLPFCDHCCPLVDRVDDAENLLSALVADQAQVDAQRIEVRGWPDHGPSMPGRLMVSSFYRLYSGRLDPNPEVFWKRVSAKQRHDVRRAERRGVTVRRAESSSDFAAFYALNLMMRRRHGMLPQPRELFDAIRRTLLEEGKGHILLAEVDRQVVAAALFLTHRKRVYEKFAPSDPNFWKFAPNHLVLWKGFEWACQNGFEECDLGRVGADQPGLTFFKEHWGVSGRALPYGYFPAVGGFSVSGPQGIKRHALTWFAHHAPDRLFIQAGQRLYRHLG